MNIYREKENLKLLGNTVTPNNTDFERMLYLYKKKLSGGRSREPSPTAELNFTWVVEDFQNQVIVHIIPRF